MADSTKDHRPAWLPLAVAAIVVPTALAGLTLLWPRPQIETELSSAGAAALDAAGLSSAGLTLSGRDATVGGVPAADRQRAIDAVQAVTGVRVAIAPEGAPGGGGGAPNPAPAVRAAPFGMTRSGDDIVLTGEVGSEEQRAQFVAAATARSGGKRIVDKLTVAAGAQLPSVVDGNAIGAVVAAMAAGPADLAVVITGDAVKITGTAADEAARSAAGQAVGGALQGSTADNQLTVAAAPSGGTTTGDLDAAAKRQLQASIAALVAGAPITFEPDSPQLTAPGRATVAKVLALVKAAPGARLQVDGYVAAGPGDGKLTAQQLSDQRAATVRDALVAGGVPADRLTATGKGEDTTAANRALGRRVAVTVV